MDVRGTGGAAVYRPDLYPEQEFLQRTFFTHQSSVPGGGSYYGGHGQNLFLLSYCSRIKPVPGNLHYYSIQFQPFSMRTDRDDPVY